MTATAGAALGAMKNCSRPWAKLLHVIGVTSGLGSRNAGRNAQTHREKYCTSSAANRA